MINFDKFIQAIMVEWDTIVYGEDNVAYDASLKQEGSHEVDVPSKVALELIFLSD